MFPVSVETEPPLLARLVLHTRLPAPWVLYGPGLWCLYDSYGTKFGIVKGPGGWTWQRSKLSHESRPLRCRAMWRTASEALADLESTGLLGRA
jgi:hypothetical protein